MRRYPQTGTLLASAILLASALGLRSSAALEPGKAITQYMQASWNSESGLPQNSVHGIAQTPDGFLWLGTEEGLARFDGTGFTIYSHHRNAGLASDYIRVLATGRDGALWIGTDSGLSRQDPISGGSLGVLNQDGRFSALTVSDGLAGDNITALCVDADGVIWVGTSRGLSRVRNGRVVPDNRDRIFKDSAIDAIAADARGTVWAGTDHGLFAFDGGRWLRWPLHDLPNERVTALSPSRSGGVWIGTITGEVAEIRGGEVYRSTARGPAVEINALIEDRDGALWIAFDRHGIGRLHQDRLELYDISRGLPSNRCTHTLFEDREGSVWVGLLDAGVAQLRDGKFTVFGKPEGLSGNYVGNILAGGDGSMWFGSDINGVNHVFADGRMELWDKRKGLPDQAVFSLLETRDGDMWIGYRQGALARIHQGSVSVFHDPEAVDNSINALFEDRHGNLWVGYFGKGVARFVNGHFDHISHSDRVTAIAESTDGALWTGWDGAGVSRSLNGATRWFTEKDGLAGNHVMSIFAAPGGDLWVGTAGGGLSRIRKGRVVSWTRDQGLPDSNVGSVILDDRGDMWAGTDHGVFRIPAAELNEPEGAPAAVHPVLYGAADGLRSRETLYGSMPSISKDRAGRLWFATIMGAARIDPARIPVNTVVPPVWIEKITLNSRELPLQNGTRLDAGAGNMEIAYTAVSFVAPQNVQFRYRLIGFDHDWIDAGARRTAWYTNLPPGNYTFEIQAQNSDGVASPVNTFSFTLKPPLARTPWAYAGYLLGALILAWAAMLLRTRRLVRQQQMLSRVVAERTAQLEAEKAELETVRRELDFRATHDSLTGLLNRPAALDRLQAELSRAIREGAPLGVMIADLDHFKNINDTCGHLCGDEVIREAARRLRSVTRGYDLVGRYGGEEFLIIFPGWDPRISPDRIDELLDALRSRPIAVRGEQFRVTCSIGVAVFLPETDQADQRDILGRADIALYAAKNSGRDRATLEARLAVQGNSVR